MALEHADEYPTKIVEQMQEMGIFGLMIPEEYGGLGESLLTYALTVEELSRGWMSISGIINTHFIVAYLLLQHGTEEQKQRYLPRMATGEVRGAFSMSEPGCGSDVAAIRTKAVPTSGRPVVDHRPEDVAHQRRLVQPRRRPRQDRHRREQRLQEHDDVPRRQGAGLRRGRARPHRPRQDREDGLQGRRHHRARPRRVRDLDRPDPRRRARPRLLPDDGRRRGGPRQRRGPGVRGRSPRLRAGHRLRPAAGDVRQEDRRAPGRAVPAGGDGAPRPRPRTR